MRYLHFGYVTYVYDDSLSVFMSFYLSLVIKLKSEFLDLYLHHRMTDGL